MSPLGNVKSSEEDVKLVNKRSVQRRWRRLSSILSRMCSCRKDETETSVDREEEHEHEQGERGQLLRQYTQTPEAFQLFLRERKLEVKQETEERIASMMPREGGTHPFDVFHTEIWLHILKYVKPEGLANMLDVHSFLQGLILEKNDLIQDTLLPVMLDFKLPIVQKHLLPKTDALLSGLLVQTTDKLLPLTPLRRVCRSFRDGIDRWIESRLLHLMRASEFVEGFDCDPSLAVEDLCFPKLDTCLCWERLSNIREYSSGPVENRPKLFFPRSLNIEFYCYACYSDAPDMSSSYTESHGRLLPERFPIFIESITEFLHAVGDQILHINLTLPSACRLARFGVPQSSHKEIFEIVGEWLSLVPNLRWLQINASIVNPPSDLVQEKSPVPMPFLEKLERFDFQGCVEEVPIWHSIISANPKISRVNVVHSRPCSWQRRKALSNAEVYAYDTPEVLALPLEAAHFGRRYLLSGWDLGFLKQIGDSKHNWNLKRLTLWIDIGGWFRPYFMSDVFSFLNNFQTLEDVEIRMDIICKNVMIGEKFLLLPNLKRFKFELGSLKWKLKSPEEGDFLFSLTFLLECKRLESLVWVNDWSDSKSVRRQLEKRKGKTMIDFMSGYPDLCESSVWDVFAKLRTITVKFRLPQKVSGQLEYLVRKYRNRKLMREEKISWRNLKYL